MPQLPRDGSDGGAPSHAAARTRGGGLCGGGAIEKPLHEPGSEDLLAVRRGVLHAVVSGSLKFIQIIVHRNSIIREQYHKPETKCTKYVILSLSHCGY